MKFFETLRKNIGYSDELVGCITRTVDNLLNNETTVNRPGMLLGKIQSGKTRAFIGIMALAFDREYDVAIVLTKGTKALADQTLKRLRSDFKEFVDNDEVQIHDIMHFPKNLTPYELEQKMIVIVKKEIGNMKRIMEALENTYPDLKDKRILIIDDEADFASVSFRKNKEDGEIEFGKIGTKIDELRKKALASDFLQVTATPYSLYLQPEDKTFTDLEFRPIRPAFTELVPIHKDYIGGDYYFIESQNEESPAKYLYEEVSVKEMENLKASDRRSFRIEESLTSKNITMLRRAVTNFIVGGCMRRLQQRLVGTREEKYSMIIHTERSRGSHEWQESVVNALIEQLHSSAEIGSPTFIELMKESYDDLVRSVSAYEQTNIPSFESTLDEARKALLQGWAMVTSVNSDKDVEELLDDQGQLKLRTPLNLFIGGQILDRGITINHLIGFFYGRSPKKYQQDTVLQHSRMYGTRSREDLAVTRFYTSKDIYDAMKRIHEFDTALRNAFEQGLHGGDNSVVFLLKDDKNKLLPCSPNKVMLSSTVTLRPHKRILPIGFQTDYKTNIKRIMEEIDSRMEGISSDVQVCSPVVAPITEIKEILTLIEKTLIFEDGYEWDLPTIMTILDYASSANVTDKSHEKHIWCIVGRERKLSRRKKNGSFSDAPDTPQNETTIARNCAKDIPAIILLRQEGREEDGWRGVPFWWPVIILPENMHTTIFATRVAEE